MGRSSTRERLISEGLVRVAGPSSIRHMQIMVRLRRSATRALYALLLILFGSACTVQAPPSSTPAAKPAPDLTPYPWVYLRDGVPIVPGEHTVSLIAVGDVLLGRGVSAQEDPLQDAAPLLASADLALGNLEGVLAEGGSPRRAPEEDAQPIILRASPAAAGLLAEAGFDILGLANNHSLDYGHDGMAQTIAHLHAAGLSAIGVQEATAVPTIREVDGVRLALLAFTAVPDPHASCPASGDCRPRPVAWDPETSPAAIAAARSQADALIISMHWGFEYQPEPDPGQQAIAAAMLDAGADLIVGHHPHVAQPLTVQDGRLVAYSLGNFLFDQAQDQTGQGLALLAYFDAQGLRAAQALPLHAGLQPRLLTPVEAQSWFPSLLPERRRIAYSCRIDGCTAAEAPPFSADARFFSGQIDLTGDGRPETIRRQGEGITIYEQGKAVWHSPIAWRVVDVALGDPNDDGRYEIMLAIWQKDADGFERSQPYIVGHRGGRYDLLWGGRPVADPILELEVGDADGDGTDEMIVIEELADGSAQAISVWRWAGWTFTHVWRSEQGTYAGLLFTEDDQPLIIATGG